MEDVGSALQQENESLRAELASLRQEITLGKSLQECFEAESQTVNSQTPISNNRMPNIPSKQVFTEEGVRPGKDLFHVNQSGQFQLQLVISTLQNLQTSLKNTTIIEKESLDGSSSQSQLENATNMLYNNYASFALFVTNYMNGRHKHLSARLRSEIKSLLSPFFTDASDIRQLANRIINATEKNLRLEAQEVEALSSDLRKPLIDIFDATIDTLTGLMEDIAHEELPPQARKNEHPESEIISLD